MTPEDHVGRTGALKEGGLPLPSPTGEGWTRVLYTGHFPPQLSVVLLFPQNLHFTKARQAIRKQAYGIIPVKAQHGGTFTKVRAAATESLDDCVQTSHSVEGTWVYKQLFKSVVPLIPFRIPEP